MQNKSSLKLTKKQLREIPAISFKQPWAWAIINGIVDIDYRDWKTNHKGLVLIHVSNKYDAEGEKFLKSKKVAIPTDLPTGGIIGMVHLVECAENMKSKWKQDGLVFGFSYTSPIQLNFLPCKGNQRIFYVK